MRKKPQILTDGWVNLHTDPYFEEFGELSELDKRYNTFVDYRALPTRTQYSIMYSDKGNLVIKERILAWKFLSNRFFVKAEPAMYNVTVFPDGKVIGSVQQAAMLLASLHKIQLEGIATKKEFLALLYDGPAGYHKEAEKFALKRKANRNGLKYSALPYITTDPEYFINLLDKEYIPEVKDLLDQAIVLNRVVKHTWSRRKMHDMHQRWTREIAAIECRNVPDDLIWDPFDVPTLPSWVRLINSEKDAVEEGRIMHHCLGTNYRRRIATKQYAAFHVTDSDGDFTVGITLGPICNLEQARKICNNSCSESQLEFANALVEIAQDMYDVYSRSEEINQSSQYIPF